MVGVQLPPRGGIVLITLATSSASAATPEQILCTEPLGSFEVKGVSNGQSISASVNVDATKRPMSISLQSRQVLELSYSPKTVVNEGWIWNSEEVVWKPDAHPRTPPSPPPRWRL